MYKATMAKRSIIVAALLISLSRPALAVTFWDAVATQSAAVVQTFIEAGADLDAVDEAGLTAIFHAAKRNPDPEVIDVLVEAGADVTGVAGWDYRTPLSYAAQYNPEPLVSDALIEHGADINARDADNMTPLLYAAMSNTEPAVLALFLERGADYEYDAPLGMRGTEFLSASHWAAYRNDGGTLIRILDLLFASGADINRQDDSGRTVLMNVVQNQNLGEEVNEIILYLLEKGADLTLQSWDGRAVELAEHNSNIATSVMSLLQKLDGDDQQIIVTLATGSVQDVRRLFDQGLLSDEKVANLPYLANAAAKNPQLAVLSDLIARDLDVTRDHNGDWPLGVAAEYNTNPDVFRLLFNAGAQLDSWDYDTPPLARAARAGNLVAVQTLLELGADVNGLVYYHHPHWSQPVIFESLDHPQILSLLIEQGADVNAWGGYYPVTPVFRALYKPQALGILLEAGADLGVTDWWGQTVLEAAIIEGADVAAVRLLLAAGAPINDKDILKRVTDPELIALFGEFDLAGSDRRQMGLLGPVAIVIEERAPLERYFSEYSEGARELRGVTAFDLLGNVSTQMAYEKVEGAIIPTYRNYGARDLDGRILRISERVVPYLNAVKGYYAYRYDQGVLQDILFFGSEKWPESMDVSAHRLLERVEISYDERGRKIERRYSDGGGKLTKIVRYVQFDDAGRPVVCDVDLPQRSERYYWEYELDSYGNPVKITTSQEVYERGAIRIEPIEITYYSYGYSPETDIWDARMERIWTALQTIGYYHESEDWDLINRHLPPAARVKPEDDRYAQIPHAEADRIRNEVVDLFQAEINSASTQLLDIFLEEQESGFQHCRILSLLRFDQFRSEEHFYGYMDSTQRNMANRLFSYYPGLEYLVFEWWDREDGLILRVGGSSEQWRFVWENALDPLILPAAAQTFWSSGAARTIFHEFTSDTRYEPLWGSDPAPRGR